MDKDFLSQYIDGCFLTWNSSIEKDLQLVNAAMGIVGETLEFYLILEENLDNKYIIDEAGDLFYYLIIYLDLLNIYKTSEYVYDLLESCENKTPEKAVELPIKDLKNILEQMKKKYFHKHTLSQVDMIFQYIFVLKIIRWVVFQLKLKGIDVDIVLTQNREKLSKRYPNGFNRLDSENRITQI